MAGIIGLLTFLNGSLMISTQRFLSIGIGQRREKYLSEIFNVSLFLHISVGGGIIFLLLICENVFIDQLINIKEELINDAHVVYKIMVVSTTITLVFNPYSAVINAHEDMWMFAISEMISTLLRLMACLTLMYIEQNLLIIYSALMLFAIVIGILIKYIWCIRKYNECRIICSEMVNFALIKEMSSFVGWNTFGSIAMICRNQGIAIVLNLFFGITMNAVYSIASQVNNVVLVFSTTMTTVFAPSIIQSRGNGNDVRMRFLTILTNKISFLLSCLFAIPIIIFREELLSLWLTNVPEHTAEFCLYILISFVITQLTPGINRAIYAVGKIKGYQISMAVCYIMNLILGYYVLSNGAIVDSIFIIMIVIQIIILFMTLYYGEKLVGISASTLMIKFILPAMVLFCLFMWIFPFVIVVENLNIFQIIVISIVIDIFFAICYFFLIFEKEERTDLLTRINVKK